jgi:hypothetical protein
MSGPRTAARKKRRLRWALWRLGWVLVLTLFWSSGQLRLSTVLDLVVAIIIVVVVSILLWRAKILYAAAREASKRAWREAHRRAAHGLARAIARVTE